MFVQRPLRRASILALGAVALMLLLPLADHHWAERLPAHEHLAMDANFDPSAHSHSGEMDREHHTRPSQSAGGRVVAFSAYAAGSVGLSLGLLTVQMSGATGVVAPPPDMSLAIGRHLPLSSGETVPPPSPPPRISL